MHETRDTRPRDLDVIELPDLDVIELPDDVPGIGVRAGGPATIVDAHPDGTLDLLD